MKQNDDIAIRKRSQIAKANKTMFLWIAGASALVGSAIVVSFFLLQTAVYNEKVLAAKLHTVSNLEKNNKAVPKLADELRLIDTNGALMSIKANESDQAIQVILDALPADGNSLALGSSLQKKLLAGVPGITSIESLVMEPIVGVETLSGDSSTVDAAATGGTANEISFSFSVIGSPDALKGILKNLERSIRLIDITSLRIETAEGGVQTMTVQAKAYYEPLKTIELIKKPVPR